VTGGGFAALDLRRGQAVAVIPSKRLVVAQTVDRNDGPELTASYLSELLRLIGTSGARQRHRRRSNDDQGDEDEEPRGHVALFQDLCV
jgi:protein required for attachment to host cells